MLLVLSSNRSNDITIFNGIPGTKIVTTQNKNCNNTEKIWLASVIKSYC